MSADSPLIVRAAAHRQAVAHLRDGAGPATLIRYEYGGAPAPARFVVFEIPPLGSEGLHTHWADDRNQIGAYDEFYYIVAGHGRMTIGEQQFDLGPGDGAHAPLDQPRGIANLSDRAPLLVHITYIARG
ncbi:MAG: cupin domain-containing protein [Proteobacteria bacterium]|nr:cupin domain-containing protein [Pseudomonadota bacterium]